MSEDTQTTSKPSNGRSAISQKLKGKPKQWKDLPIDPLAEGYQQLTAAYIVGNSPVSWVTVTPGQLFSRTKTGKNLYVKLNDGRGVSLDTKQAIEVKPQLRNSMQVWLVTNFNSISAPQADF